MSKPYTFKLNARVKHAERNGGTLAPHPKCHHEGTVCSRSKRIPRRLSTAKARVTAERDALITDINAGHPGRTYNRGYAEGRREALHEALKAVRAMPFYDAHAAAAIRELLDAEES